MHDHAQIQISYIGGGSREWARSLFVDLALQDYLSGELVLHDCDQQAAEANVALADGIFAHPDARSHFKCRAEGDLREALAGADIVVISIEPGDFMARRIDLLVPERYGILQSVGDTTGPGGLLRALRCYEPFTEFAQAIQQQCPQAWVVNYSNPMTVCTALLYAAFPAIRAVGCCHEVFGLQSWFQRRIPKWFDGIEVERHDIHLDVVGVNHFTWATAANWRGADLFPYMEREIEASGFFAELDGSGQADIPDTAVHGPNRFIGLDFFRRFGVPGAAGDAHLVEFVPWYLASDSSLATMGTRRKTWEWRCERQPSKRQAATLDLSAPLQKSCEEGVEMMQALMGGSTFTSNVNVRNEGRVSWLPEAAIIECNALFRCGELSTLHSAPTPLPVQSLIRRVVDTQQLIIQGLVTHDPDSLFQALLCDPLLAHKRPDQIHRMWQDMLQECSEWIPDWARVS